MTSKRDVQTVQCLDVRDYKLLVGDHGGNVTYWDPRHTASPVCSWSVNKGELKWYVRFNFNCAIAESRVIGLKCASNERYMVCACDDGSVTFYDFL
jgi:hypothetical protein